MKPRAFLLFATVLLATAYAQDTRHVTEPSIPIACTTLLANLSAPGGVLAEADESKLDSLRIQRALDSCGPGRAVVLKADGVRNAFLSGPLELRRGVTLAVDAGAWLLASRDPRVYDVTPGACGIVSNKSGCKPLIRGDGVADASVMGDGVIDGRGGARLLGQEITWWGLADKAGVRPVVTGVTGRQQCPRILVLRDCDNFTLYRITLKNSPNYHVTYEDGNGFTVWGVKIWAPGKGAKNTDGLDPGNSTNVTITHCYINAGDDNACLKPGEGKPTTHMSIVHNHFYAGHGMSIGSQTDGGASAIRVSDLSIDGAQQGIRIKSNDTRGGPVNDVVYEDVCIRNTANPIVMDANYASFFSQAKGRIPIFTGILLRNVRILDGGTITLNGYDAKHRLGIAFDNVVLDTPEKIKLTARHAIVTEGPGPVNFRPEGEDVTVLGKPGHGSSNSCKDKFVPFPEVH
ncbi:MAG: glycoside hydrolase family 28 protein [Bryobacteraceae bacterium]